MDEELRALAPVFLEEARERLRRLAALAPALPGDDAAFAEAKRELHTLKGAGRMMQLGAFAELCHAAEEVVLARAPGSAALLTEVVDALAAMADAVEGEAEPAARPALLDRLRAASAPATTARAELATTEPARAEPPATEPAGAELPTTASARAEVAPEATTEARVAALPGEVRVDADALDAFAERAARVRSAARASGRLLARLHELARLTEEGMTDVNPTQILAVAATSLRSAAIETEEIQSRLARAGEEQLEAVLALELQPLGPWMRSLARYARDLARSLGREVRVELEGEETRLDRRIARELEGALVHLVANAVDHGCEPPAERRATGKPEAGLLRLAARSAGRGVEISLEDDGRGIDPERVIAAAVERGLLSRASAAATSPEQAIRLLFLPGFSTRASVSLVSGRGVGLDAVESAVARVGGEVRIASEKGRGTSVALEVPAARRGERVLLVRAGGQRFAVPAGAVEGVRALPVAAIDEREGRPVATLGGRVVPFVALAGAFGLASAPADRLLLEARASGRSVAIAVDRVDGEEEILVRPLPGAARAPRLLDGVALLLSGEPVALVSLAALAAAERHEGARPARAAPRRAARVLLVDDSRVTREMERRILEDAGFTVELAAGGEEALRRLAGEPFDCLVTDIEMPGMDGYRLTEQLRGAERFARLPVVVVTTRNRPEERLRGLRAGADAYLTKQNLSASELVETVRRLAGA